MRGMGNNTSGLQEEAGTKIDLEIDRPTKDHLNVVKEENHETHETEGQDCKEKVKCTSLNGRHQGVTGVDEPTSEDIAGSKVGSCEYNEVQPTSISDDKDNTSQLIDTVSKEHTTLEKYDHDIEKVILTKEELMENSSSCTKTSSNELACQGSDISKSDQDHTEEEFSDNSEKEHRGLQEEIEDMANPDLALEQNGHLPNAETLVALCGTVHFDTDSELDKQKNNLLVAEVHDEKFEAKGRNEIESDTSHTELLNDAANDVGQRSSTASVELSGLEPKIISKTEMITIHEGYSGANTEESKSLIEESEIEKGLQGQNSNTSHVLVEKREIDVADTNQSEAKVTNPENAKTEEKSVIDTYCSENNEDIPPEGAVIPQKAHQDGMNFTNCDEEKGDHPTGLNFSESKLLEDKREALSTIKNGSEGINTTSAKEFTENYTKPESILPEDHGAEQNVWRLNTESSPEDSNTCIYLQKSPSFEIDLAKEQKVQEPDQTPIQYHHRKASISISSLVSYTTKDDKIAPIKETNELASDATTPVKEKPVTYERNDTEKLRSPSLGISEKEKEAIGATTPTIQGTQHPANHVSNESFNSSKGKEKRKSVTRLFGNCVGCGTVIT